MKALSLIDHLAAIEDPRRPGGHLEHPLVNVLAIGFCGVICGCESFTEMHEFGECKREFFESLLDLANGIPSHDTFGRVFAVIPPETLMQALSE